MQTVGEDLGDELHGAVLQRDWSERISGVGPLFLGEEHQISVIDAI